MLGNLVIELLKFIQRFSVQFIQFNNQLPLLMRINAHLYQSNLLSFQNTWSLLNHPQLLQIEDISAVLKRARLLNQNNLNRVYAHTTHIGLKIALFDLQSARILNQENFDVLVRHSEIDEVTHLMVFLSKENLLNHETRINISRCQNPMDACHGLEYLKEQGLLSQQIIKDILESTDSFALALAYSHLESVNLLTDENKELLRTNPFFNRLAYSFRDLINLNLLNQESFNLIINHFDSNNLAEAFVLLHQKNLLTSDNHDALVRHNKPHDLAQMMVLLSGQNLLTPENRASIIRRPNIQTLLNATEHLKNYKMLNQANFSILDRRLSFGIHNTVLFTLLVNKRLFTQAVFTRITAEEYNFIFNRETSHRVWEQIPSHLFNAEVFERLMQAARGVNPLNAMIRIVHEILGFQELAPLEIPAPEMQIINRRQSTHTASVHQSASVSALKLQEKYGLLNLEEQFKLIRTYLKTLNHSQLNRVALNCLNRLMNNNYQDSSGVSLKQLMVLCFVAIHDDSMRMGELKDGLHQFVTALYEIQRGNNIERGDSDEEADAPICPGGAFNKFIEKLKGVHPLADVIYLTDEIASFKLQKVAPMEAFEYLKTQASKNLSLLIHLMLRLDKEGFECIWDAIKAPVSRHFFPEFALIYLNSKGEYNERFLNFIEVVKDMSLSPRQKDELKGHAMASKGYHEMCSASLKPFSLFSLYERRHDNAFTQHQFDCRYGLIIKS